MEAEDQGAIYYGRNPAERGNIIRYKTVSSRVNGITAGGDIPLDQPPFCGAVYITVVLNDSGNMRSIGILYDGNLWFLFGT